MKRPAASIMLSGKIRVHAPESELAAPAESAVILRRHIIACYTQQPDGSSQRDVVILLRGGISFRISLDAAQADELQKLVAGTDVVTP